LAVNTVVQNWDTYGIMNHNYYLYTDPETGLVTWIPWDNNMALTDSVGRGEMLSLSLAEVMEKWPLIRFLIDDPVYQAQYQAYLGEVVKTAFVAENLTEIYTFYHNLIADSVLMETDEATTLRSKTAFDNSLQELIDHAYEREQAVEAYLSN
jgi:spore coat protein H